MRTRRTLSTLAALAAVLGAAGCSIGLEDLPSPSKAQGPTYEVSAQFTDVESLTVGADVKLGGVLVGEVTDITTRDYRAAVRMRLEKRFRLGRDLRMQIRFTTPLGEDYVAITSAGHPAQAVLTSGAVVPLARTRVAPTIEDTFAAVSTLLNYGGLDKLHTIVTELTTTLHGRTGDARSLLENLQKVVTSLDSHKQDINRALDGLDRLSSTLAGDTKTITAALDLFPPAISTLTADTARLRTLVGKVGTLGTTISGLLDRGQAALLADLDNLAPTLTSLQARSDELIPTFQSLTRLGKSFQRAVPGDYLNVYATIQFLLNADPPARPPAHGTTHAQSVDAVQRLASLGGGP